MAESMCYWVLKDMVGIFLGVKRQNLGIAGYLMAEYLEIQVLSGRVCVCACYLFYGYNRSNTVYLKPGLVCFRVLCGKAGLLLGIFSGRAGVLPVN